MDNEKQQLPATTDAMSVVGRLAKEAGRQLAAPEVMRTLIATTFSAFKKNPNAEILIRQAVVEAMINGWTFEDILRKKVYAIPFGEGYQLVQAIKDIRSVAAKSGHSGTSKPVWEETTDLNGKKTIVSCTITVWKNGGHPEGYSDTAYFDEYYKKGKTYGGSYTPGMWDLKPRTMLAKVAEAHALRKAFPELLSESYIEEEFQQEQPVPRRNITQEIGDLPKPTIASITNDNHASHEDGFNPTYEERQRILEEERAEAEAQRKEYSGELETPKNSGYKKVAGSGRTSGR